MTRGTLGGRVLPVAPGHLDKKPTHALPMRRAARLVRFNPSGGSVRSRGRKVERNLASRSVMPVGGVDGGAPQPAPILRGTKTVPGDVRVDSRVLGCPAEQPIQRNQDDRCNRNPKPPMHFDPPTEVRPRYRYRCNSWHQILGCLGRAVLVNNVCARPFQHPPIPGGKQLAKAVLFITPDFSGPAPGRWLVHLPIIISCTEGRTEGFVSLLGQK